MTYSNPPIKKRISRKLLWSLLLIVLLTSSFVVYFRYFYVYSEGTRVGILIKFSKKGNIFKTYEGEIQLVGFKSNNRYKLASNAFYFSVTNENVAKKLMTIQGQEVQLHYNQYNNSLWWRGDSYPEQEGQYIVDAIVKVTNDRPTNGEFGL